MSLHLFSALCVIGLRFHKQSVLVTCKYMHMAGSLGAHSHLLTQLLYVFCFWGIFRPMQYWNSGNYVYTFVHLVIIKCVKNLLFLMSIPGDIFVQSLCHRHRHNCVCCDTVTMSDVAWLALYSAFTVHVALCNIHSFTAADPEIVWQGHDGVLIMWLWFGSEDPSTVAEEFCISDNTCSLMHKCYEYANKVRWVGFYSCRCWWGMHLPTPSIHPLAACV